MAQSDYRFLFDFEPDQGERVFQDPTLTRQKRMRRVIALLFVLVVAWSVVFLNGALSWKRIADEVRVWSVAQLNAKESTTLVTGNGGLSGQAAPNSVLQASATAELPCGETGPPAFSATAQSAGLRVFGHIPTALEWAPLSLKSSCGVLDVLTPEWLTIKASVDGPVVELASEDVRAPVDAYVKASAQPPKVMPTVTLAPGFDVAGFLGQLTESTIATALAADLVTSSETLKAAGLCLDFQQLDASQITTLDPFFERVSQSIKDKGLLSCAVFSAEQKIWADKVSMRHFDNIVVTAFRKPWVGSVPGPLAQNAWFEALTKQALTAIGEDRLTIAIGNFSVEWVQGRPLPKTQPYAQAILDIAQANTTARFSAETGNSQASFRDSEGMNHRVWLLDAASAHNQIKMLRNLGVRSVAVWSLGLEDPGLWQVLTKVHQSPAALGARLTTLRFPNYVSYQGAGPFLRVLSDPKPGTRVVKFEATSDQIIGMEIQKFPRPYVLERYGQGPSDKLVLTFDDGPHAEYTAAILDALKDTGTPASFFVVGTQVMENPDLLKRMIDDGHEVGSHTFSHPRMDQISNARTDLEHGMMSKLIAGYSGHSTRLYREPFLRAGGPIEEGRVHSLKTVQQAGGIIAGMEIVPKDWEGMSAAAIVDYVVTEVNNGAGNVILLHDGGKDRRATVEAVPILIKKLTALGYQFTTLADLLAIDRAALLPIATGPRLSFDKVSFGFLSVAWTSLEVIFWVVLAIGILRTSIILILAMVRKRARPLYDDQRPKVAIVIPAFNEKNVIAKCIQSALDSQYENLQVIVIDDGSQDGTFDEILRFRYKPNIQIFAQLNRGKWSALNAAIANCDAEIVVCVDADTEIEPDAIEHLVRHFSNPKIGAVAGKISVGNRRRLLTRLQALEYVTSQNFDRRAFDLINGLMVVPGAIGAWRVSAVRDAGRFCNDTITEDADMTVAINRAGYRVTYEDKAVAYTEAPESVRQLLAQRSRWTLGMFQCAWKHKSAVREGRAVGLVTIPDMLIFGYLFPLLAPIADIFVAIMLYKFFAGGWSGDVGVAVSNTPGYLIWAYAALPLLDLIVAAFALKSDKRESMGLLLLFPFQRFFYRQLLYLSVYRSVLSALGGTLVGWGKMKRSGRRYVKRSTQ